MGKETNQSNSGSARRFTALGLLLGCALAAIPSCGGSASSGGTDSNTHWLKTCSADSECGSLRCLCGVCTRSCKQASQCGEFGDPAVCEAISSCSGSARASTVCTAECSGDAECTQIGAGLTCVDGRCESAPSGNAGSAGQENSGSGGRGSGGAGGASARTGGTSSTSAGTDSGGSSSGTGGSRSEAGAPSSGGHQASGGAPAAGGIGPANAGSAAEASGGTATAAAGSAGEASGGASTGGTVGSEAGAGGAPVSGNRLVLDPSSLVFFGLPIDSIRFAVTGYDAHQHACATIVWMPAVASNPPAMCNVFEPDGLQNPYVIIQPDTNGPCTEQDWDYSGNVTTTSSTGCVDFTDAGAVGTGMVDAEIGVEGDLFTGTIVADNRPEGMVTFGLEYVTDVPASIYVQRSGMAGLPEWIHVTKDGEPVTLFEDCGMPNCDIERGVCGVALQTTANVTGGYESGSIYLDWDGQVWSVDQENDCVHSVPASAGTYEVEACFGRSVTDANPGSVVAAPLTCRTREFTLPADKVVVVTVDEGG
jgi:hypothetical protein